MGKSTGIPEPFHWESRGISSGKLEFMETCRLSIENRLESWWFPAEFRRFPPDYETTSTGILDFMQSKLWTILREDSQIDLRKASFGHFSDDHPLLQSIHPPKLIIFKQTKQNLRPIVLERN